MTSSSSESSQAITATAASSTNTTAQGASSGSSCPITNAAGKKICCACPETKRARDECMIRNGEEGCRAFIEAHKECLRREGFNV